MFDYFNEAQTNYKPLIVMKDVWLFIFYLSNSVIAVFLFLVVVLLQFKVVILWSYEQHTTELYITQFFSHKHRF